MGVIFTHKVAKHYVLLLILFSVSHNFRSEIWSLPSTCADIVIKFLLF